MEPIMIYMFTLYGVGERGYLYPENGIGDENTTGIGV